MCLRDLSDCELMLPLLRENMASSASNEEIKQQENKKIALIKSSFGNASLYGNCKLITGSSAHKMSSK